ncbi:hypothetical protein F4810DRAFT_610024 [Camillea tinctor]|nr:hypothetical protein F4810DRAFT_610024 [Camillea tinctor]
MSASRQQQQWGRSSRTSSKPPQPSLGDARLQPPSSSASSPQAPSARRRGQTTRAHDPSATAHHHHHHPTSSSSSSRTHTTATKPTNTAPAPKNQTPLQAGGLEVRDILSHPRLQQATGMLPRKVGWWEGLELSRDELSRLQWAMSLPDVYPRKKPKGNF